MSTMSLNSRKENDKGPGVSKPDFYDGSQHKLEEFLIQLRLYFAFNGSYFAKESDKVLYAASYLRARAARGVRPYVKDWLDNEKDKEFSNPETRKLFAKYELFEAKLTDLYGVANEETYANRHIRCLRQTTSVSAYTSEFQGYAAELDWNEAALKSQFYLGLKDAVKAQLFREDEVDSLTKMVKAAKRIDERLQDLKAERHLYWGPTRERPKATGRNFSGGGDPMELDATSSDRNRSSGGNQRRKVRCYKCQRLGHIARDCGRVKPSQQEIEFNSMEKASTESGSVLGTTACPDQLGQEDATYEWCVKYLQEGAAENDSERADARC